MAKKKPGNFRTKEKQPKVKNLHCTSCGTQLQPGAKKGVSGLFQCDRCRFGRG